MTWLDRWREIMATLARRKLRTALTALSVAWGIFMLVVLLAAGQGLSNGAENAFADDAANSVYVQPGRTRIAHAGHGPRRRIQLTNEDLDLLAKAVPVADRTSARFRPRTDARASFRDRQGDFQVSGVQPDHQFLEKTTMEEGRYINDADIAERRKVAVIGLAVAQRLFRDLETPIGQMMNLGKNRFRVIGTFSDTGEQREQETIYIPVTTAQLSFAGGNRIDSIVFSVGETSVEESNALVEDLQRRLAEKHSFSPVDKGALRVFNRHEFYQKLGKVLWGIRMFVWLIGLGTIMAGVVGVGNIMLIAVKERTREFGMRKALGATPGSIVAMVLEEALVITTVSGYVGLVAGVALVEFAKRILPTDTGFFREPDVNIGVGIAATAVLVVAGLAAGFWPARRAARINPIEALRAET
ncbi:MAG: ABC transporter permease [Deltaproteobacteria bacterium]|nr:ABC transporter permease [Deltaproteobacteria bacterium]